MEAVYNPLEFASTEPIHLREYFDKIRNIYAEYSALPTDGKAALLKKKSDLTERQKESFLYPNKVGSIKFCYNIRKRRKRYYKSGKVKVEDDGYSSDTDEDADNVDKRNGEVEDDEHLDEDTPSDERGPQSVSNRNANCAKTTGKGSCRNNDEYSTPEIEFVDTGATATPAPASPSNMVPDGELVVHVMVYLPTKWRMPESRASSRQYPLVRSLDIAVLGSQTLAELRDKIPCASDFRHCTESITMDPIPNTPDPKVMEDFPSGFIFINDVFYNDMRKPNCIDYSDNVIEWASKQRNVGNFSKGDMATTRIVDLSPRFHYPYLYTHQGDCEHVLMFVDARLLLNDDESRKKEYPYLHRVYPSRTYICNMCSYYRVTRFVLDSDRSPHNVTYYCERCFKSYNFIDGKRVGNFKAYPFYDRSRLY